MALARRLAVALWTALAVAAAAQPEGGSGVPQAPILTLDQERLFTESLYGQRAMREIEEASAALAAENRAIEAELMAEERALTERRPDLPPEEFRAMADAFDARVTEVRREQDAKARALQRRREQARRAFLQRAVPILSDLVAEAGAVAILDDRAVLLSAEVIDVTDEALARIDSILGDGGELAPPEPESPEAAEGE
jgi:Skp family chaperone for outer membrane proteins